jgi:hypothetical protein
MQAANPYSLPFARGQQWQQQQQQQHPRPAGLVRQL